MDPCAFWTPNMGPHIVNHKKDGTRHPEHRLRRSKCFSRVLGSSRGPYSAKHHKGGTCYPERRETKN
eukprot:1228693-Pyramimonas_sp.AAC.1